MGTRQPKVDLVENHAKIRRFFDATLREHPVDSAAVVGWSTWDTQSLRFRILTEIAALKGSKILDVGCGVGDLYGYISRQHDDVEYVGIDLHAGMIAQAKKKYPFGVFRHQSLEQVDEDVDFICVSGAFNLRLDDNEQYIQDMLRLLVAHAKMGVAFNLLSSYAPYNLVFSDLYYYDPEKVFSYCKKLASRVTLRHDYLSNDFSVYVYKD